MAGSVLTSAAKASLFFLCHFVADLISPQFEESLRNADDPDGLHRQAKACATIVYFSCRMEAVRNQSPFANIPVLISPTLAGVEGRQLHCSRLYVTKDHGYGTLHFLADKRTSKEMISRVNR